MKSSGIQNAYVKIDNSDKVELCKFELYVDDKLKAVKYKKKPCHTAAVIAHKLYKEYVTTMSNQ